MPMPFSPRDAVALTSTTSSQTVTVPGGSSTMVAYNAAANPVYLKWGTSVAAPGSTFNGSTAATMVVQPGTTQTFSIPISGGTLAYIATTAGGALVIAIGDGE